VVAQEYGFENWTHLKRQVQTLQNGDAESALTDLIEAANNGRVDRIAELLDAHPEIIDRRGGSGTRAALHFAAIQRHPDAISLLLQRGANPDIRCEGDEATALHFAAELGDTRTVEMLVSHGADVQGAIQGEHDLAQLMIDHGAPIGMPAAMALNRRADIDRLMKADPQCLKPGGKWDQLILSAAKRGSADLLGRLLDHGADVNTMGDFEGDPEVLTALHVAAYSPSPDLEVIRLLVERGADLQIHDTKFNSPPRSWAHHRGKEKSFELLKSYESESH